MREIGVGVFFLKKPVIKNYVEIKIPLNLFLITQYINDIVCQYNIGLCYDCDAWTAVEEIDFSTIQRDIATFIDSGNSGIEFGADED